MRYFTIEQRESLQRALELRAARLMGEVRDDLAEDLNAEPEAAALKRDVEELRAIEEALRRLHQPEFGLCADCGESIPYTRLEANPAAMRCIDCEREHEKRGG
jgi:DnaK suppressor protein